MQARFQFMVLRYSVVIPSLGFIYKGLSTVIWLCLRPASSIQNHRQLFDFRVYTLTYLNEVYMEF